MKNKCFFFPHPLLISQGRSYEAVLARKELTNEEKLKIKQMYNDRVPPLLNFLDNYQHCEDYLDEHLPDLQ